jgi:hypothetical protein
MADNIRLLTWLLFCLLFEFLFVAIISLSHNSEPSQLVDNPGSYHADASRETRDSQQP